VDHEDALMARAAHRPLTYDDLLAMPDDDLRHELIDGEHYVTASPNLKHQRVSGRLYLAVGNFLREHPIGEVFYAPCDVVFSPINVVVPDLLYVSKERVEVLTQANLQGAPDLIVEILSPSTRRRDEGIKRRLYERMGVREYWLADPLSDTLRVYRREGEALLLVAELSAESGDVLTTPLLPGLELPLAEIFA
jgi:Uma2 family endonuclease